MKTLSISSEQHFYNFITGEIASGRCKNAEDIIHEAANVMEVNGRI